MSSEQAQAGARVRYFFHGMLAGLRGLQSGYHDDRHMGTYLCQLRLDLKAVHLRHVLVEDNTVRRMIL
jgi:hypothetical protein